MESGILRHSSGRFFNEKEINFAKQKNPKPNYSIRIEKRFPAEQIEQLGKKIVPFFKKEIVKLKKVAEFVNT